jgi:branched-chain amino acid transport system substrate-binding protein
MLVPEAAKLQKKKWVVVYPELRVRPVGGGDLQGDAEEAAARRRVPARPGDAPRPIEAGAVVQALVDAKPDAIFNVLFGADLSKFVREGNTRSLFKGREV